MAFLSPIFCLLPRTIPAMPTAEHAYETTLWTDARSLPTVQAIVSAMGQAVRIIGVGGPRQTPIKALADTLGAGFDDDLRRLMIDKPSTYLLLATMNHVDPLVINSALKQGCTILALEPIAADFRELEQSGLFARQPEDRSLDQQTGHYVHCPAFTQSPGWLRAADPQIVLDGVQGAAYLCTTRQGEGSLFARLHEAWRMLLDLMQLPESIDCSILQPDRAADPSLRHLNGQVSIHARLPDQSSAILQLHETPASNAAAPCDRQLQLIGERGRLRVTDRAYELFDHQGALLDEAIATTAPPTFAATVVHHWQQLIDRPSLANPPRRDRALHEASALACCLACLLSARTGTAESPGKLLAVNGWK